MQASIEVKREKTVKIAKPNENIRTRPKTSPTRPKLTTNADVANKNPVKIDKKQGVFDGANGSR